MATAGISKIKALQQRWIVTRLLTGVLLASAFAVLALGIFYWLGMPLWWDLIVFLIGLILIMAIYRPWQISLQAVSGFLNVNYPALEESAALALKQPDTLNLLERLQLRKIEQELQQIPHQSGAFSKTFKTAILCLIAAVTVTLVLTRLPQLRSHHRTSLTGHTISADGKSLPPEKVLPQIEQASISIHPPAYTRRPPREQSRFTIVAEDGALVGWHISTNVAVKKARLIFNGRKTVALNPFGNKRKEWKAQRSINQSGFYQVEIDGILSDLYQVQVIKDALPVIHIKGPKQYTHIDAGESPKVLMTATLSDDYGVSNAMLFATVAKGSGEGVKFKEYQMPFNTSFAQHNRQYNVQRLLDLPALNMEPGDELYFYIQAQDNRQQKTRTDVYIVSIQDTAQLLSMDGLVAASNIKPEYFRSQRQIIIETEVLIKGKDSIAVTAFKNKTNDLGIDQKMLRLRYGKFLGEEDESGTEGEENDEISKAENFGNGKMVMDAYTDKHDNAEDATFLEPAVKAQLKATLTEMWKAELQLRMNKPQAALPFEYKALRLLKDLQQKSRSYVAKTAYNPPPLKPEKRLSGELDKIGQPLNQKDVKGPADRSKSLQKAIEILEQIRSDRKLTPAQIIALQPANQQLTLKASAEPGIYLPAIGAMRRILSATKNVSYTDIGLVEKAIQRILPKSKKMPGSSQSAADMGLGQTYYKNLDR